MLKRLSGGWRSGVAGVGAAVLLVSGVISAFGGSSDGAKSGSSASSKGGGSGITIHAAEFNWTAATVTNAILEDIVKAHPELGVGTIASTPLDPAAAWAGAGRGDVDLLTEVALPNQQLLADKAKSNVTLVSQTYGNAVQGWFVPSYTVQPGGQAAGLTSISQLNQYRNVFGGRLIDADPGWVTTQQNTERLKAYGINFQDVPSGAAAQLGQLERNYRRKQPVLIYLYKPHWVFATYKLTQLQEPNAYKAGCFTGGNNKCAIPTLSAWIAASRKVAKDAPKFYSVLKQVRIPLGDMESMLEKVDVEKKPAASVAQDWITTHKAQIDTWLRG